MRCGGRFVALQRSLYEHHRVKFAQLSVWRGFATAMMRDAWSPTELTELTVSTIGNLANRSLNAGTNLTEMAIGPVW